MQTILFKNAKISFSDVGHGDAVVLLHGFLENSRMWHFFEDDFKAKKRIISIDLLGHGKSESLGYIHRMEDNAEMVFAVLEFLDVKKCSFVGHSMGGYVALAFAEKHSNMVEKLVLLNSTSAADSDEKKQNRDRAIVVVKKDYVTFVRMAIANLFAEKNREKLAQIIEKTKLEALKTPLRGIIASLEGMKMRSDETDLFRNLKSKKMLILGKKDTVLNFDDAKKQIENSDIQLIVLDDGHMSHLENTIELKKVFQTFFE